MAKEILAVPEERLAEVCRVIRAGLLVEKASNYPLHPDTVDGLEGWCADIDEYLQDIQGEGVPNG